MKTLKKILTALLISILFIGCSSNDDSSSGSCATECAYTVTSSDTAGTVPSTLEGTYNLTYHSAQTGSPFTNGTTATFTVANNELTVEIDGECITLKNPVLRGTNNFLFKDTCNRNITFNMSPNNDGTFNEINIEPIGQGWLGQFS